MPRKKGEKSTSQRSSSFSIQETKLEDHSPSQVKEKTLQPLDIGFYRLGM